MRNETDDQKIGEDNDVLQVPIVVSHARLDIQCVDGVPMKLILGIQVQIVVLLLQHLGRLTRGHGWLLLLVQDILERDVHAELLEGLVDLLFLEHQENVLGLQHGLDFVNQLGSFLVDERGIALLEGLLHQLRVGLLQIVGH